MWDREGVQVRQPAKHFSPRSKKNMYPIYQRELTEKIIHHNLGKIAQDQALPGTEYKLAGLGSMMLFPDFVVKF